MNGGRLKHENVVIIGGVSPFEHVHSRLHSPGLLHRTDAMFSIPTFRDEASGVRLCATGGRPRWNFWVCLPQRRATALAAARGHGEDDFECWLSHAGLLKSRLQFVERPQTVASRAIRPRC